jgi:hypothetical protein
MTSKKSNSNSKRHCQCKGNPPFGEAEGWATLVWLFGWEVGLRDVAVEAGREEDSLVAAGGCG